MSLSHFYTHTMQHTYTLETRTCFSRDLIYSRRKTNKEDLLSTRIAGYQHLVRTWCMTRDSSHSHREAGMSVTLVHGGSCIKAPINVH